MADSAEVINFLGEYLFERADLIAHDNSTVDITAMVADVTLFEDVFSPTMSGHISIEDALDMIDNLPLIGQERLRLRFRTPSLSSFIDKEFYVYKLHSRTSTKRVQRYILSFCSIELIQSQNTKISRAYSGKISDTVSQIFYDPLSLNSDATLYVEATRNSYTFIPAYWSPIETINWLSNKAVNENGTPNYLFFESNKSFEFVSMERLMESSPIREYVFTDTDANTVYGVNGDINKKYSVVESIDTAVTFDYLRNLSAGMLASKLATFDMTMKNISVTSFDYIDDFSKSKHLEKYPLKTDSLARRRLASLYFIAKDNYQSGAFRQQGQKDQLLQRNSLMSQLSAFKMNLRVPGRTDMKVGMTIKLVVPAFKQIVAKEIESEEAISDYYSGKYLITAIKHTFVNGHHSMVMEVVSDSFAKALT